MIARFVGIVTSIAVMIGLHALFFTWLGRVVLPAMGLQAPDYVSWLLFSVTLTGYVGVLTLFLWVVYVIARGR